MQMQIIIDKFLRSEKSHLYKLSCYEKIILIMLSSYMGSKNTCWPSLKSLTTDCSISKDSLLRNTKSLEKKDLLTVKRIKNENNIYEFSSLLISIGSLAVQESNIILLSSRSQLLPSRSQLPVVVADSHPNNIINNINNNRVAQLKDYEGPVQSASKASSLLENFMNK